MVEVQKVYCLNVIEGPSHDFQVYNLGVFKKIEDAEHVKAVLERVFDENEGNLEDDFIVDSSMVDDEFTKFILENAMTDDGVSHIDGEVRFVIAPDILV